MILFAADGEAAGQDVFHVHLHVIPRFRGDAFDETFGRHRPARERADLDRDAAAIAAPLA